MIRILFAALALAVVLVGAQQLRFAPAPENEFKLEVEKTGLMRGKRHVFLFDQYEGSVLMDAANPEVSKVRLSIEASSIACKDTWVSAKDLKKVEEHALNEMLAVSQHKRIEFESTGVTPHGGERFLVDGMLTIRGVAKPVRIEVTRSSADGVYLFEGRSVFKMTAWGLKPPSAALGAIGTKDEMTFSFKLRTSSTS